MANREISEEQYLAYNNVASTVQKILAHPSARRKLLEAQKTVSPEINIPELDDPREKEIVELKKGLEEIKADTAKRIAEEESNKKLNEFSQKWNSTKERVRKKYNYTDEGIENIEKLCQERGIADFEAGAALFEKINPTPEPINYGDANFSMFSAPRQDSKYAKELFESRGESSMALQGLINETLADVRRSM